MVKLIAILAALIPIFIFVLRFTSFGKSKALKQASSDFRKQVGYAAWAILFVVGASIVYSLARLIYSIWN